LELCFTLVPPAGVLIGVLVDGLAADGLGLLEPFAGVFAVGGVAALGTPPGGVALAGATPPGVEPDFASFSFVWRPGSEVDFSAASARSGSDADRLSEDDADLAGLAFCAGAWLLCRGAGLGSFAASRFAPAGFSSGRGFDSPCPNVLVISANTSRRM